MNEQTAFKRSVEITVDAALIGIGRDDWASVPDGAAAVDEALKAMRTRRFDVMPIRQADGGVSAYFVTRRWGDFSAIERRFDHARRPVAPPDLSRRVGRGVRRP
jgi:hypothetical protein